MKNHKASPNKSNSRPVAALAVCALWLVAVKADKIEIQMVDHQVSYNSSTQEATFAIASGSDFTLAEGYEVDVLVTHRIEGGYGEYAFSETATAHDHNYVSIEGLGVLGDTEFVLARPSLPPYQLVRRVHAQITTQPRNAPQGFFEDNKYTIINSPW